MWSKEYYEGVCVLPAEVIDLSSFNVIPCKHVRLWNMFRDVI